MKDVDKEFIGELDVVIKKEHSRILDSIVELGTVISFEFIIDIEDKEKYGLNDDISFIVSANAYNNAKIKYCYDGVYIEPENYYLRPDDYHEVSILDILKESINQKTSKPDIKFLERGEKKLVT